MSSEIEIKAMVLNRLLKEGRIDASSLVFNEMNLARKARRVDLGYMTGREIVAVEIKSEKDTLSRLPGQLEVYLKYFDRVILVVASKFVRDVLAAVSLDVEVWEVSDNTVSTVRRGRKAANLNKEAYLDLMTKREVSILARKLGVSVDGIPMFDLKLKVLPLLGRISKDRVKAIAVDGLSKRFGMPSRRFLSKVCSAQTVTDKDIPLLSPYTVLRGC